MPTALEDASFVQNAKSEGYGDDEIYDHLAQHNTSFAKIRDEGYTFPEVHAHILDKAQQQAHSLNQAETSYLGAVGSAPALKPDKSLNQFLTKGFGEPVEGKYGGEVSTDSTGEMAKEFGKSLMTPGGGFLDEVNLPGGIPTTHVIGSALFGGFERAPLPRAMKDMFHHASSAANVPENVMEDFANFATSPVGLATTAIGGASPIARKAIAAVFTADTAHNAPEIIQEFRDAETADEKIAAVRKAAEAMLVFGGGLHESLSRPEGLPRPAGMSPEDIAENIKARNQSPISPPDIDDESLDGLVASKQAAQAAAQTNPGNRNVLALRNIIDRQLSAIDPARISESEERISQTKSDTTPTSQPPPSTPPIAPAGAGGTAPGPSGETTSIEALKQQMRAKSAQAATDPLRVAAESAQDIAPEAAEAAKGLADTLQAKVLSPQPVETPVTTDQPTQPNAAQKGAPADEVAPVTESAVVKPEPVDVVDYDEHGKITRDSRLESEEEMQLAKKRFESHKYQYSKLLDCLGR